MSGFAWDAGRDMDSLSDKSSAFLPSVSGLGSGGNLIFGDSGMSDETKMLLAVLGGVALLLLLRKKV